ncbi:MAG: hypothetical protein ABSC00_04495 [Acidimicrobiales bacterium]
MESVPLDYIVDPNFDPDATVGAQPTSPPASVDEVPRTRKTSERKRASNAANATRSTGPKTPEGKTLSSKNATTHGLYQQKPQPIQRGPFAEDPEEVHEFVAAITSDLEPRDSLEKQFAGRIASELLRGVRLERVEGTVLSAAGALTSREYDDLKQQVATAADLVDYLDNPDRESPGSWRYKLVDFINSRTDPWSKPSRPHTGSMYPPQALQVTITHHFGEDVQAAQDWARAQLAELEEQLAVTAQWDEGGGAEGIVRELAKLGVIGTQSTRNLQRLLAEYRRLQLRTIDTESDGADESSGN